MAVGLALSKPRRCAARTKHCVRARDAANRREIARLDLRQVSCQGHGERDRAGPSRSRSRRRVAGALQTERLIGISRLIVGVASLFAGLSASESISSEFSKLFQGAPSDKNERTDSANAIGAEAQASQCAGSRTQVLAGAAPSIL